MAGFCEFAIGLQAPNLTTFAARTPKVSDYMPRYSHFRETAGGDWGSIPHCMAGDAVIDGDGRRSH
jgi:hypothetical protein